MSNNTSIQWTDVTDNIIEVKSGGWWCRKISPGCVHCYAEKINQNPWFGGNKLKYNGEQPTLNIKTETLDSWARQTKPKRHFVASMTDVFGEWIHWTTAVTFLDAMLAAPLQTFQILTKRPQHMADLVHIWLKHANLTAAPKNIWLGVSVEDQKRADERIPVLISIPAAVRFLSVEPMLEAIDMHLPHRDAPGPAIDWVIVGGESGRNARPCNVDWVRSVVEQCQDVNVACFVKQFGSKPIGKYFPRAPWSTERDLRESGMIKHSKGGDPSEWPMNFPREFPKV